ncbi:MAG: hypothetical protein GWP03_01025 [Proteobacteria bacterium]|nr:hypothetical protein [Pseudomonadota bacterium]
MVIFYAVGGEGMGHATRSEAIIRFLLDKDYKIVIFSYDRALNYMYNIFKDDENILEFVKIAGVNFVYKENEFRLGKTMLKESTKIKSFLTNNTFIFLNRIIKYNPNLVITDFEPFSNTISKLLKIPLICIDNINIMAKCDIDHKFSTSIHSKLVKYILNFNGNYNFITTVFDIPLKDKYKSNTYLVGPIVRKEFFNTSLPEEDFILVYQTSQSNLKLFDILKQVNDKFIIYGFNENHTENNLVFKSPDKEGFIKDLLSCKAVITNGGFSLISEAVTLKKPIYSIPIKNQTEQEINAFYVEKSGFGIYSKAINYKDLEMFLDNLNIYKGNLKKHIANVNDIYHLLDDKIAILVNSYKMPSRIKMALRIKHTYDILIVNLIKLFAIGKKLPKWISSISYAENKAKLFARLSIIKNIIKKK